MNSRASLSGTTYRKLILMVFPYLPPGRAGSGKKALGLIREQTYLDDKPTPPPFHNDFSLYFPCKIRRGEANQKRDCWETWSMGKMMFEKSYVVNCP